MRQAYRLYCNYCDLHGNDGSVASSPPSSMWQLTFQVAVLLNHSSGKWLGSLSKSVLYHADWISGLPAAAPRSIPVGQFGNINAAAQEG